MTDLHPVRARFAAEADELAARLRSEIPESPDFRRVKTVLAQIVEGRAVALRGPNPVEIPGDWFITEDGRLYTTTKVVHADGTVDDIHDE